LPKIPVPVLFVQGTRDPLCALDELRPVIDRMGARASLHVVDGGDHSLDVPKAMKRTRAQVVAEVADVIDAWLRGLS
jgi:predicted alpha/beta-hydrolase family hydrolase